MKKSVYSPPEYWWLFYNVSCFDVQEAEQKPSYGDMVLLKKQVKPYLRRWSNITSEELTHILQLALNIPKESWSGNVYYSALDPFSDRYIIKAEVNNTHCTLTLNDVFDVKLYSADLLGKGGDKQYPVENALKIVLYLIEQDFDLFGWIEQDIALPK